MKRFGWAAAAVLILAGQPASAFVGGLLGMGGDLVFCNHQKKGRLKVVTSFGLRVSEALATNTTMRTLALMARDQNTAGFKIIKAACGTLMINGVQRGRQCTLVAEPATSGEASAYTRGAIIRPDQAFDTSATLHNLATGYVPLPVMHGLMKAGDACPIG